MLLAAVGSMLPDIDTSKSFGGRMVLPISRWIENRFPHRTITHSILATAILALVAIPIRSYGNQYWAALLLGHLFGWISDAFTKSGVAAFYPLSSARLVIPANPRLRLSTGSRAEFVLQAVCLLAIGLSFRLYERGGLMRTFNQLLGQPEGAAALFVREGNRREVIAHINGRLIGDQKEVDADFQVIEVTGERILVADGARHLYLAGLENTCQQCELSIHRVQAFTSRSVSVTARELRFQDQELSTILAGLTSSIETRIYITGELHLRDAHLLSLPRSLQYFNSVELSGSDERPELFRTVKLHSASPEDVKPLLKYFGSGNLLIREVHLA